MIPSDAGIQVKSDDAWVSCLVLASDAGIPKYRSKAITIAYFILVGPPKAAPQLVRRLPIMVHDGFAAVQQVSRSTAANYHEVCIPNRKRF
jgi:hypothetical protein